MMTKFFFSAAMAVVSASSAHAIESAIPITPTGGTDLSQAILPPPGLYGALVALPFNRAQNLYDNTGHKVPDTQGLKVGYPGSALVLAYVYPFDIFGGHVLSSTVLFAASLSYNIADTLGGTRSGLGDTYTDVFFWSKNLGLAGVTPGNLPLPYGLTFGGGFAMTAPTEVYNPSSPLNIGSGVWVAIPNFALTYTTGPNWSLGDSTEVSARFFYGVPTTNTHALGNIAAGYTSGNVIDVDWSASQRFGNFRAGVTGSYTTQVSNDTTSGGGQTLRGNRYTQAGLGPIVEYTFPDGVIFKIKYVNYLYNRNSLNEQFVAASIIMKLW